MILLQLVCLVGLKVYVSRHPCWVIATVVTGCRTTPVAIALQQEISNLLASLSLWTK
jgi:hypothetical protein